jgi:hypothetical protein
MGAQTEKPNEHLGAENASQATADKVIAATPIANGENRRISLAGEWKCQLDEAERGVAEKWYAKPLDHGQPINLPGTLAMAKIGKPNPEQSRWTLTPETINTNLAWYQKELEIPADWKDKSVIVHLERCGWESRLWIDGEPVGVRDALSTPHEYVIEKGLGPGKHLLTIRMNSRGRPGASCHGWGEDTQGIWNGIMGRMDVTARDRVYVDSVVINARKKDSEGEAQIQAVVKNALPMTMDGVMKFSIRRKGTGEFIPRGEASFKSGIPEMTVTTRIPIEKDPKEWSEFEPNLYELKVDCLAEGEGIKTMDQVIDTFGVRSVEARKGDLLINNRKAYLRGTHDGCAFPLIGAMSCDLEEWRRICKTVKSYGLNHIRYHSVCPPKELFEAADEQGIYILAELPFWGHVKKGWAGTAFLRSELDRIIKTYGNHPSFCFMTMGNEHAGDWDMLEDFVVHAKQKDPRRLYASVSNGYIYPGAQKGYPIMPEDQFWVSMLAGIPKEGKRMRFRYMEQLMNNEVPDRAASYSEQFVDNPAPGISHELGQFVIFPNLQEIPKYTGVMKPRNFERFKQRMEQTGLLDQGGDFFKASGASAIEEYKEDVERILRTPECSGFELLDLHDYPGQGTALVGVLDVFWDSKGLITPERFRRFCNSTVLLSSIKKSVWTSGEQIGIPLSVTHYGLNEIPSAVAEWTVKTAAGRVIQQGKLAPAKIANGQITPLGTIEFNTSDIVTPEELTLTARIEGTDIENDWRIWCYPPQAPVEFDKSRVLVTDQLDDRTAAFLQSGGKVLLTAGKSRSLHYIDWSNAIWTQWVAIKGGGSLIQNQHPALKFFPSRFHNDWQWWDLLEPLSCAFSIPNKSIQVSPIVQSIDEPIRNLKLGMLFEARVGNGAVLATSIDVESNLQNRPATRQFLYSLEKYVASPEFNPQNRISMEELKLIVDNPRFSITKEAPMQGNVMLDIEASGNLNANGMNNWKKENDKVVIQQPGYDWQLIRDDAQLRWPGAPQVSWVKDNQKGWMMNVEKIAINVPEKFSGTVYLFARDLNKGKRPGEIIIGREVVRYQTDEKGSWIGIKVRPEDVVDGKIVLYTAHPTAVDAWSVNPIYERLRVVK